MLSSPPPPSSSLPLGPSPTRVEVLVENDCYWIHNALNIQEQIDVFRDILERSKHMDNAQKRPCMNPSPKTLIFDDNKSTLRFGKKKDSDDDDVESSSLSSVYHKFILQRAITLASKHLFSFQRQRGFECNRYSVGVIRYDAPNGSFPEHVDHCNDPNGWVFLLTLGCSARFSLKGPTFATKQQLELQSGDILVFNPSTEAAIMHGVSSIISSSCPKVLAEAFRDEEIMANHRYGVQCRTSLED